MAWRSISPEVTVVDEANGNMLWNDSEEAGDARSECEEDDGTDCEDENGESDTDW